MKLAVKSAWMCASAVFLITAMPAFFEQIAPLGVVSTVPVGNFQGMTLIETTIFSLMGSLMAGAIGYIIGDILANPQGPPPGTDNKKNASNQSEDLSTFAEAGNETFLDDLSSPVALIEPAEPAEIAIKPAEALGTPTETA